MSESDLFKLFSSYDGEVGFSDFTPEELRTLLKETKDGAAYGGNFKEKYFEYYDDVKSRTLKKQDW